MLQGDRRHTNLWRNRGASAIINTGTVPLFVCLPKFVGIYQGWRKMEGNFCSQTVMAAVSFLLCFYKMNCSNVGIFDMFTELSRNIYTFFFFHYVAAVPLFQLTPCSSFCARFVDDLSQIFRIFPT
jgi:hypothetical protein